MADFKYLLHIAHAEADLQFVELTLIPGTGLTEGQYILPQRFRLGAPIADEFQRAVRESRYTLLVMSAAWRADRWAPFVESIAVSANLGDGRLICLLRMKEEDQLPPWTGGWVCLRSTDAASLEEALKALREHLALPPPVLGPGECPYPGMRPFKEDDARSFFGRAEETEALVRRLDHLRRLFVIGPSGSGKSSLIYAGLLPRLRAEAPRFVVRTMRPGQSPVSALRTALGGAEDGAALAPLLAQEGAERALLIVDQLEEAFTQADAAEQGRFFDCLEHLRRAARERCTVLLAMRADFYGDLMSSALWPQGKGETLAAERLDVAPLRSDRLREAIRRPAEDHGVYLEEGLLERLMADAAHEPGVLPLMQETLTLLWKKIRLRQLTVEAYEAMGKEDVRPDGSRERLSGLAVAVARKADGVLLDLPDDGDRAVARRILLRLVQFGEGREDTRRQQTEEELMVAGEDGEGPEARRFHRVLRHLADHRLLTVSSDQEGTPRVDIAHEVLLRSWPLLKNWVGEKKAQEETRRRLEDKARQWTKLGSGRGGLLDAVELPEAEVWMASDAARELGDDAALPKLVAASRAALEEEKRRLMTQRRRLLALVAGLAVSLVGVSVMAVLAARQQREAQDRLAFLHEEQGRQLLLQGDPARAVVYLARAYEEMGDRASTALRLMLAQASKDGLRMRAVLTHDGPVQHASVSPDGRTVATVSGEKAHLWDRAGKMMHVLDGRTVDFSPDGRWVVTSAEDRSAKLWDVPSGRCLRTLSGHTAKVTTARFSPDGEWVLTGSADGTARLWDARTGAPLRTLAGREKMIGVTSFSPDGRLVATGAGAGTTRLWDARTGAPLAVLRGDKFQVGGVTFRPDGQMIATREDAPLPGMVSSVRLWDVDTGRPVADPLNEPASKSAASAAAFSPDGSILATATTSGTTQIWDPSAGAPLRSLAGHGETVTSAAFSPDGQLLVTASKDLSARLWDTRLWRPVSALEAHQARVTAADFGPDGQLLVTASHDHTARLWDAYAADHAAEIEVDRPARLLAMGRDGSPDGARVLTAGYDGTMQLRDTRTGSVLRTLPVRVASGPPGTVVDNPAFSPDGRTLLVREGGGLAQLWDVDTGRLLHTLGGEFFHVRHASFSPDGRTVLALDYEETAGLWDARSGKRLRTLTLKGAEWYVVPELSPDGRSIVTAGGDGTALIWDAGTGARLRTLRGHAGTVRAIGFSADGQILATGSDDHSVRIWDMRTGGHLRTLEGHEGAVGRLGFSADGRVIATDGWDDTTRLWDARSGRELIRLHKSGSSAQSFWLLERDRIQIVTLHEDAGLVRVYDISPGRRSPAEVAHRVRCHASFVLQDELLLRNREVPSACQTIEEDEPSSLGRRRHLHALFNATVRALQRGDRAGGTARVSEARALAGALSDRSAEAKTALLAGVVEPAAKAARLKEAQALLESPGDRASLLGEMAVLSYEQLHEPGTALGLCEEALKIVPTDPRLRAHCVEMVLASGRTGEFLSQLREALKGQAVRVALPLVALGYVAARLSAPPAGAQEWSRRLLELYEKESEGSHPGWSFQGTIHALRRQTPPAPESLVDLLYLIQRPKSPENALRLAELLRP